jgi:hypothetical protein
MRCFGDSKFNWHPRSARREFAALKSHDGCPDCKKAHKHGRQCPEGAHLYALMLISTTPVSVVRAGASVSG